MADTLYNGWLTKEAARRLGVAYPMNRVKGDRLAILYDRPISHITGNSEHAIIANKVYLDSGGGCAGYIGGLIEVIPVFVDETGRPVPRGELPKPLPAKTPYLSPFDGEVK